MSDPKTQKPRYIETVHSVMSEAYPDQFKLTVDEFEQKLSSNPEYLKTVHSVMSEAYPDQFKLTPEDFGSKLAVKKKEQSGFYGKVIGALEEGLSQQQKPQQKPSATVTESDLAQFKQDYGVPEQKEGEITIDVQEPKAPISSEGVKQGYERQVALINKKYGEYTPEAAEAIRKLDANMGAPIEKVVETLKYKEDKDVTDFYKSKPLRSEGLEQFLQRPTDTGGLSKEDARKQYFEGQQKAIEAVEADYLDYLAAKGNEYEVNKYNELKGRTDLSTEQQRFMRDFRIKAMSALNATQQAKIYEVKQQADVDEYSTKASVLAEKANNLRKQYEALGIKEGVQPDAATARKANELAAQINEVASQFEALGAETGFTPELQQQYESALSKMATVRTDLDPAFSEARAEDRTRESVRRQTFETALANSDSALGLTSEAGKAAGVNVYTNLVGLAEVPKIWGDFTDDKDYDFIDEWYDSVKSHIDNVSTIVDPLKDGKTSKDLPSSYQYAKLIGDAVGSVTTFAAGGAAAKALKLPTFAGTFSTAFMTSQDDYYNEAISAGMNPQEAAAAGVTLAAITGAVEGLVPDVKYFESAPFRKSIIQALVKGETVGGAMKSAMQAVPASVMSVLKSATKEGGEELIGQLSEDLTKTAINSIADTNMETFNPEAYKDSLIAGMVTGGGMSVLSRPKPRSPLTEQVLMDIAADPEKTISYNPESEEVKTIAYESAETLQTLQNHPNWERLTPEQQNHALSEVLRKKQLEATAKGIGIEDESIAAEVGKIDAEVGQILSGKPIEQTKVEAVPDTPSPEVELEPVDTRQPATEEVVTKEVAPEPEVIEVKAPEIVVEETIEPVSTQTETVEAVGNEAAKVEEIKTETEEESPVPADLAIKTAKKETSKNVAKSLKEVQGGKNYYDAINENNLNEDETKELAKSFAESKEFPKKQFTKKEKIQNEFDSSENIDVKPIEKKVKTGKSKIESLSNIVEKKDLTRVKFTGVFFDSKNKKLVATDAHKLVAIDDPSVSKSEIIDPKTKQIIDDTYPDYASVIPKDNPIKRKVSVKEMLSSVNGLVETKRFFEHPIHARIEIGDMAFYYNPEYLSEVLTVMAEQGVNEVEFQLSSPTRALVMETGKGIMGLVMPMYGSESEFGFKTILKDNLTAQEKNGLVQKEINDINRRRNSILKDIENAEKALKDASEREKEFAQWDVDYNKKRLAEIDLEISEKRNEFIDNPIQEAQDKETVKTSIENGEITTEQATEYVKKPTKRTRKAKQPIEVIESKAESDDKAELNEVIDSVDKLIEGESAEPEQPKTKPNISDNWRKKADEIEGLGDGALMVLPKIYAKALRTAASVYDAAIAAGKSVKQALDEAKKAVNDYFQNDPEVLASDQTDRDETRRAVLDELRSQKPDEDPEQSRIHSVIDRLINESATTSKREKKKMTEDVMSKYAVMTFDKIEELGGRIVDELGGLDNALAEARKKNSSIPIPLQSFIFGQAIIKARQELKKAKENKNNRAIAKWSDYSNEAAQDLSDKATAFGQYNAYIQQFYENSAIAIKHKIKKAVREHNELEAPQAEANAKKLVSVIEDMTGLETDLDSAIDNLDDFRVKELEQRIAELEKQLKDAKKEPKQGKQKNFGIKKEAFDAAMKRLMSSAYSNPFGNPEFLKDAAIVSVYAIGKGFNKFADFAKFLSKAMKGKYVEYYGEWYKDAKKKAIEDGSDPNEFDSDEAVDELVESGMNEAARIEQELAKKKQELEVARKTREFGRLLSVQIAASPKQDKVKKLKELAASLDEAYGGSGFAEAVDAYVNQKQIDKSLSPSGVNANVKRGLIEAGYVRQDANGKDQVDWKKIVEGEKNPQEVADKLEKALQGKVPQYAIDAAKKAVTDTIVEKKKQAISAFIKSKRRISARRALGRARRTGNIEKLLKLWNQGGLNDQDVLSILADDFGAEQISTAEETRINELVDLIDSAPNGSAEKEKAEEELQAFLHSIGQGWLSKVFWDQMQSRLLSGPITTVKNLTGAFETAVMLAQQFVDSNLNTALLKGDVDTNVLKIFKKAQGMAVTNMVDIWARGGVDMGTAFSEITKSKEGSPRVRYIEYIRQRGRTLPDLYVRGMNLNVYNTLTDNEKYVGRTLSAADTWNQIVLQEISTYNFIKRKLLRDNPNMSAKQAAQQAMDVMYGKDIEDARRQATKEFDDMGVVLDLNNISDLARFNRRVNEIVVQARGDEALRQGQFFANRYTFKTSDTGLASGVGHVLQVIRQTAIPAITAHLKRQLELRGQDALARKVDRAGTNLNNAVWGVAMPFIKGVANIKEKGLEYNPIYGLTKGVAHGLKGATNLYFGNKEKASDSFARMREYQFRAAVGFALLAIALGFADDDEEEGKALYALGTGDFRKDEAQKRERPDMTLRTKGGKNIPLEAFGAAAEALKIRALYEDYKRYNPDVDGDAGFVSKLIAGLFYDNYTEGLMKLVQGDTDPKRMSAEFVARGLVPFTQLSRQSYQMMNDTAKKPISWLEHLAKYSGLVAGWSLDRPAFDYRGKEYKTGDIYSNSAMGFVGMLGEKFGADEVDRFVMAYHPSMVTIGSENKDYEILFNDGTYNPMTDLEYYEFKLNKSKTLDKYLTDYYNAQPLENVKTDPKLTDVQYEDLRKKVLQESVQNGEKLDMSKPEDEKIVDERIMAQAAEFKLKQKIKSDITELNTHATKAAYEKLLMDEGRFIPLDMRGFYGTLPKSLEDVARRKEFKLNPAKSVSYE